MQRHVNTKLYPMFWSLGGFVLGEHELLRQAGKEAVGQGDDVGGCHISTNSFKNLGFLLEALETEKCPHRAGAAAVPGWLKQETAWVLFLAAFSCSGCLPAGLFQQHYPEESHGIFWGQLSASGQQEMLHTECSMRLQSLELGGKGGSGERVGGRGKKPPQMRIMFSSSPQGDLSRPKK